VGFTIAADKFEAFDRTAQAMTAGTRKEPGAILYDWFLSSDRKQCRLLEEYRDGDAVVAHLNGPVVRELVPQLLQSSTLTSFEVFGDPGAKGTDQLAKLRAGIYKPWHALRTFD
jgi:quinol monooxygenase YgiN